MTDEKREKGAKAPADSITLSTIINNLTKEQRAKLTENFSFRKFMPIFEDAELMRTAKAFLDNGMNVTRASKELFMHRNTLMYRLNSIKKATGLDLHNFDMALTFEVLHLLYERS